MMGSSAIIARRDNEVITVKQMPQFDTPNWSRRRFLQRSGMGMAALGVGTLAAAESAPMRPKSPHYAARAKAVIHIFFNKNLICSFAF